MIGKNARRFERDVFRRMQSKRHFFLAQEACTACAGLAYSLAWAEDAPAGLAAYERETSGRIGVYAENVSTGARMARRAEERFFMCSGFKQNRTNVISKIAP